MENSITRAEHEEFSKRITEENTRQNRRIALLEDSVRQINDLTISVKEMAVNMGNMLKELEKQGERLEKLEAKDGERWRKVVEQLITVIIGIVVGFVFTKIGM